MHDNSHLAAQSPTVKRQMTGEGAYQEGFGVGAGCGEVCLQVLPEVGTGVLADGLPLASRPEPCVPADTKSMSPTTIFHCKDCKYHEDQANHMQGHASCRTDAPLLCYTDLTQGCSCNLQVLQGLTYCLAGHNDAAFIQQQ